MTMLAWGLLAVLTMFVLVNAVLDYRRRGMPTNFLTGIFVPVVCLVLLGFSIWNGGWAACFGILLGGAFALLNNWRRVRNSERPSTV